LESEGVSHIESMGEKFDPTKMEAIAMIPSPEGVDSGTVVEVVEEGYMIHDRVLRASRVIVSESTEDE
jgi:molecular chaperone GrpE